MKGETVPKNGCSIPIAAERLGISKQAIYQYINRFFEDFTKANCVEVKKHGLRKSYIISDYKRFLKILKTHGAEFETK